MKLFSSEQVYNEFETRKGFNYKFVATVLGIICMIQIVFLLMAIGVSAYYKDEGMESLLYTVGVNLILGVVLLLYGRGSQKYDTGRREGMVTVSLSWFVIASLGMLPYYLGGFIPRFADAFFEAISGFTTTGATILNDIEALPHSILFWRSLTQWIGGIGIIVFLVALVPLAGDKAVVMYDHETTGVTHDRFVPRIGVMAKWIMLIYLCLSVLCMLLLWAGPMNLFDAVCHAATCISTGGFSNYNTSIATIDSHYTNIVLTIFMIIAGTSFMLIYFAVVKKEPKRLFQDSEFRWYVTALLIASLFSSILIYAQGKYDNFWNALEHGSFQTVTLMTTTGYAIADYNYWGSTFWIIALFGMFVAGCSGSTSGGLKMIRFNILTRNLFKEFTRRTHPHAVVPIRINGNAVKDKVVMQVANFFFAYIAIIFIGAISISVEGFSLIDALSGSIACASNSGPGLSAFGPMNNYFVLSDFNKILMSILMVVGRLEIFTVLTLFHKSFWKN